jgi:hypothetical protein
MIACNILDTSMPTAPPMLLATLPQNAGCLEMPCSHVHGLAKMREQHTQSKRDLTGDCDLQPCTLYNNPKDPQQQLFLAAAALYMLTEESNYRDEADYFFDPTASLFHTNWNNVYPLGVAILAGMDTVTGAPEAHRPTAEYQRLLRRTVQQWSDCSNKGSSGKLCKYEPFT